MRLQLAVALFIFTCSVWAGGYQGCLERVHLFQAYEVDGLMQAGDRILGFKCRNWVDVRGGGSYCRNNDYVECAGSRPGGRCTFDELQDFMRPANERQAWAAGVNGANGRIDPVRTAVNCYNRYQARGGNVPNFPAYRAMRGGNVYEFNDYIRRLGDRVDFVYRKQTTSDNNGLFTDFDDTRNKINIARAADHGPFLEEAARTRLGFAIYTHDLGRNPATGEAWSTVNWAETANKKRLEGMNDIGTRIRDFLNGFYRGPDARAAAQHFQVFKSYKYQNDRAVSCGRRGMQQL